MNNQQTVIVNQKNEGCLSGCGSIFAVLMVVGLAVEYWYVSATIAVIAVGAGIYTWHQRSLQSPPASAAVHAGPHANAVASGASSTAAESGVPCETCGHVGSGNFCAACGAARTRVCSDCDRRGLESPFCPDCGAATYTPPTPS